MKSGVRKAEVKNIVYTDYNSFNKQKTIVEAYGHIFLDRNSERQST